MKVHTGKLLFSLLGLLGLFLGTVGATTIVEFNFNDSTKKALITDNDSFISNPYKADSGTIYNINNSIISLNEGPLFTAFNAGFSGTDSTSSNNWHSGSNVKYWMINLSTVGFTNLTLSSKQRSSNATGPRDFKVQYKIGSGSWMNISSGTTIVSDNFINGVFTDLALPSALNNNSNIYIRWLVASTSSPNGNTVTPTGTSRIDDIKVEGIINQYTTTFQNRDNSFLSSGSVNHGSDATAPTPPLRTGYTFSGWNTPLTNITGDTTFTAQYNMNTYTVTYTAGANGTISGSGSQTINYGADASAVTAVANTGYSFVNRSDGGTSAMRTDTNITGAISVTASFVVNQYALTFDTDGGTPIITITGDYHSSVTAPANPTKTGYTFSGWDTPLPATIPAMNTSYTAQWTINTYTVTFQDFDNTFISSGSVNYGSDATAPTPLLRTGYTFSGWDAPLTNITGDTTFTAQYNINQYSLIFNTNGGSLITTITGNYNSSVTAPANPTKTGYTFSGWDTPIPSTIPAMNTSYTAEWNVNQYTVTFDTNSGSLIAPITGDYGTAFTVIDPTRSGYNFAGWNPSLPATIPAMNTTYVAQWTLIVPGGPATTETTSGGGGGYTLPQDSCPNGDKSPSYYDGTCVEQTPPQVDPNIFNLSLKNSCFTPIDKKTIDQNNNVSQAFKVAHQMLYSYGLTTWKGTQDYRPYDYLTRAEAAKFMVEFADNVLCRTTNRSYDNNFSDIAGTESSLLPFIKKAYEYNIFNGDHTDATSKISTTFRPSDRINNDELTAIMIRLVTNSILEESLGGNWAVPYTAKLNLYTKKSSLDESGRGNIAEVIYDVYRNNTYKSQSGGYVIQ